MQLTKRQIVISLLLHFFIVFGFAHAGACIGLIEILYFPYFDSQNFSLLITKEANTYLSTVGFFGLLGNVTLIACFFIKQLSHKAILYIVGVVFYILSIVYLANSDDVQFSVIFCLPLILYIAYIIIKPYLFNLNGWFKN